MRMAGSQWISMKSMWKSQWDVYYLVRWSFHRREDLELHEHRELWPDATSTESFDWRRLEFMNNDDISEKWRIFLIWTMGRGWGKKLRNYANHFPWQPCSRYGARLMMIITNMLGWWFIFTPLDSFRFIVALSITCPRLSRVLFLATSFKNETFNFLRWMMASDVLNAHSFTAATRTASMLSGHWYNLDLPDWIRSKALSIAFIIVLIYRLACCYCPLEHIQIMCSIK